MKILCCACLFVLWPFTYSQQQDTSKNNIVSGFYVTALGDTVRARIKIGSRNMLCRYFEVVDNYRVLRLYPDSICTWGYDNKLFVSRTLISGYQKEKRFVQVIKPGYLSLYTFYQKGLDSYGYYNSQFFFFQKGDGELLEITPENFRKKISDYLSENMLLSQKIKKREYRMDDLLKIVEEYNKWYELNYAYMQEDTGDYEINERIKNNMQQFRDPEFGFEVPVFLTTSIYNYPEELSFFMKELEGGAGYNFGIGLRVNINQLLDMRAGLQMWQIRFKPEYEFLLMHQPNSWSKIITKEDSHLKYTGIYLLLQRTWHQSFVGTGFNLAFNSRYHGEHYLFNENGRQIAAYKNQDKMFISSSLVDQIDLMMMFGANLRPAKRVVVKPTMAVSYGLMPVMHIDYLYSNDLGEPHCFVIKFGLVFEYGFDN